MYTTHIINVDPKLNKTRSFDTMHEAFCYIRVRAKMLNLQEHLIFKFQGHELYRTDALKALEVTKSSTQTA